MKLSLILITSTVLALSFFINNDSLKILMLLVAYAIISHKILLNVVRNISKSIIFDENFLMSIASLGAIALGDYQEAVAIILFYQVGEFFEHYSIHKSRKSIKEALDLMPQYANLKQNEKVIKVDPKSVKIDDILVIKPGERIPLDGIIIKGSSFVDTSALTGESNPRDVQVGDEIKSGYVNTNGLLEIKVKTAFENSTVSRILDLVENSISKKSKSEKFIRKFARVYTPVVVVLALLVALLPPIFIDSESFSQWATRAIMFLVVSCPCALVVSVPLSFFSAIGSAYKKGILIKGSNYLEIMSKLGTLVFDKTGTLTKGQFVIDKIVANGFSEDELLKFAAYGERYSNHPIALSLLKAYNKDIDENLIKSVEELPGLGVRAIIDDNEILIGNKKLVKFNENETINDDIRTAIYISINSKFAGYITFKDELRDDAKYLISYLKQNNINVVMLTGDNSVVAQNIAQDLGIDEIHSQLLPDQKVKILENILKNNKAKTAFIGDGINDAPVLARSDLGLSMFASDAAMAASDIVLMDNKLSKIISAIELSKNTMRIVKQNIVVSISVKVAVMLLGIFAFTNIWVAIFADVGVSIVAILNSFRANLRDKR